MTVPPPTRLALLGTLALIAGVAALFVALLARGEPIGAQLAGSFLLVLSLLFALRVVGQVLVVLRAPEWLPPMESGQWNLMPYRFLLPIQLAFLGVMAWLVGSFLAEKGVAVEPRPTFGWVLIAVSGVYAGAMAIRYVVRMRRRTDQRWLGGTIPIFFHWVLASFLYVLGSFHASH
jgi:uncharacterized protein